jgi:hypothetical protein
MSRETDPVAYNQSCHCEANIVRESVLHVAPRVGAREISRDPTRRTGFMLVLERVEHTSEVVHLAVVLYHFAQSTDFIILGFFLFAKLLSRLW